MPNELINNDVISKVDVLEEINNTGDGGNLDDKWFDVCDIDYYTTDVENSRSRYLLMEENVIYQVGNKEENYILLQVGDTVDKYLEKLRGCHMIGLAILLTRTTLSLI